MFELKCWQFILFGAVLELLYQNIIVLIDLLHDFAHQWLNGFDVGINLGNCIINILFIEITFFPQRIYSPLRETHVAILWNAELYRVALGYTKSAVPPS